MKIIILYIFLFFVSTFWYISYWANLGSSPDALLNEMKNEEVQKTPLDEVWGNSIESSLRWIKENSSWYISWLWFIWLSIALILVIYNGIYILANFSNEDKISKVKKRFVSLAIGIVVLTSWYLVIEFSVSVIWSIFK